MEKKIVVISAILEHPAITQAKFNEIISAHQLLVKGRMGLPMHELGVSVISITCIGTMDEINALTGKLGNLCGVTVTTSISKKTINE